MSIRALCTAAALLALPLAGCVVGPDYEKPSPPVPEAWSTPLAGGEAAGEPGIAEWWRVFGDPTLDALVARALEGSLDLRMAEARIRESRAAEEISGADLWPALNASAGYKRLQNKKAASPGTSSSSSTGLSAQGVSRSYTLSSGGTSVTVAPDLTGAGNSRVTVNRGRAAAAPSRRDDLFQAGFDARWELDVFGGTQREREAARASREAAEEDLRAVRVSLAAEVARNYFTLREAQASLDIASRNAALQRDSLDLVRARFEAGLTNELDIRAAEAQLAVTESALPGHAARVQYAIHRLGVLMGRAPGALQDELAPAADLPPAPPMVPVGLPSDLLRRRPDVRAAERDLAAATARIGVATADLFPKFALTGALSGQDDALYGLKRGANLLWSVGPTVQWPVFDAGRIRANIRVQNARQEQALAAYEKAVLTSLEEAENALVAYAREQNRLASLDQAVTAAGAALTLAKDLYTQGLTDYLRVLDAERSVASAEAQRAQSRAAVLINLAALYKALGGGWSPEEAESAAVPGIEEAKPVPGS
ncbi:MAG TPA: efflux transporter outer membrane subunit [Candidatus Hydrogenedentes bacterium]|nr:efflux transporter outer membrane subunit [Candidatus Hydrogenedentota bacterium]